MKSALCLVLAVLAILGAGGCAAFRQDVSSVSVYGGYRNTDGDAYKAGVRFDLRPLAAPSPAPRKDLSK